MASTSRPATSSLPDITGLILAGGEGRRMGGRDKGLQLLHGRPLVHWVVDRLRGQVSTILISANRHLDQYAQTGASVFPDGPEHVAGACMGPLAGLHAGLTRCHDELLLCAPCDTPFLPGDLAARLCAGLGDAPLAVARCAGKTQPTLCLLRRSLADNLGQFLTAGGRKMGLWQAQNHAVLVDFPNANDFININTGDELSALDGSKG